MWWFNNGPFTSLLTSPEPLSSKHTLDRIERCHSTPWHQIRLFVSFGGEAIFLNSLRENTIFHLSLEFNRVYEHKCTCDLHICTQSTLGQICVNPWVCLCAHVWEDNIKCLLCFSLPYSLRQNLYWTWSSQIDHSRCSESRDSPISVFHNSKVKVMCFHVHLFI